MHKLFLLFILLHFYSVTFSQTNIYLGIEPRFGRESWYEKDEWNVNIAPIVVDIAVADHIGIRAKSSVFMHTSSAEKNEISLTGMGLNCLYFWKARTDELQYSGLFLGPWAEINYDHVDNMQHLTVAGEVGYSFVLKPRWTINLSAQLGYSTFSSDEYPGEDHFGVLFNIGYWIF